MGDPTAAASHVLNTLKPYGTLMIVEPFSNDDTEDNFNPVGRIYYAAPHYALCVLASLAHNGPALGAQTGESRFSEVVKTCGFTHFHPNTI
jgi:hypothetical protein